MDRAQLLARDNLQSDVLRTLDQTPDAAALLTDLVSGDLKQNALARLNEQLQTDPALATELLSRVETLLVDLLEEPS